MAEVGVRDLRMDDVADRAEVGKATIYRRYRSKNALIGAAVATLVSQITIPDTGSTRGDLLAFHKRYFQPENVILGVWGDFNTAEMKRRIEKEPTTTSSTKSVAAIGVL